MKEDNPLARSRRKREFTKREKLATHPIIRLLESEAAQEVQKLRDQEGLRFKDFQLLLCDEQPSRRNPKGCTRKEDCQECNKFKGCHLAENAVWISAFSDPADRPKKIYSRKSHLADDLGRLCKAGYIEQKTRGSPYAMAPTKAQVDKAMLKRAMIRDYVRTCPPDKVQLYGDACFLLVGKEAFEGHEKDDQGLRESIEMVKSGLLILAVRSALTESAKAFKKQVGRLKGDEVKTYLQRYLLSHISTRLGSLGLLEETFTKELSPIRDFDLGLDEERAKEIDAALTRADSVTSDAKKRLSKAFWLTNLIDSPAEAFMDLTTDILFDLEPEVFRSLKKGRVSKKLNDAFTSHKVSLSPSATLTRISSDAWLVSDQTNQYLIEETNQGIFTIHKKMNERLDLIEILEIRRHLSVEEAFGLVFLNSGMCVPLELRRNLPLVVLGGS